MENRTHYAKLNIYITLICQILTMICGILIPRVIITTFGSELYGATSSITQFLSYITLLEGGICGVARAALYKPLADSNDALIGQILNEIQRFFRILGFVFLAYVLVLASTFKAISHLESYDWISTFLLVIFLCKINHLKTTLLSLIIVNKFSIFFKTYSSVITPSFK